ncbi:MAG TPA: DUF1566 domain-containing protein [Candidatus Limnocylindrales bacterium]|nr:DUF1566 domain-containing protein [Candidatus Limnocylindrales bacterium]
MKLSSRIIAISVFGLAAIDAAAAVPPDAKCESGQLKAVASYASCRLKADATSILKNLPPDFTKCSEKILSKFANLEDPAGVCNSEGDVNQIITLSDDYEATVAFILSGSTTTTTTTTTTLGPTGECGDGAIDAGEDCDIGNLGGATCASEGFFNGTLACGPGCTFVTTGCHATRFEDTGTTILDHQTELEWEKKGNSDATANLADPHDVDNTYTWAASGSVMSGTLYTDFLLKLNGVTTGSPSFSTSGCYASHCDWRVPTIDELKTITILSPGCGAAPCVQDALFLPNRSGFYWSNSSVTSPTTGAYVITFNTGAPASDLKTTSKFVRAVRSTN